MLYVGICRGFRRRPQRRWSQKAYEARYFSTESPPPFQEYSRQILKKFIFQTHPDFFTKYPTYQSINSTNLRYLQALVDEPASAQSKATLKSIRTLSFYLKGSNETIIQKPRKVKVSLTRLLESMTEILETVGLELPPKPPGYSSYMANVFHSNRNKDTAPSSFYGTRYEKYEKTWLTTETKKIVDFLESLPDRKEIFSIKQDLYQHYKDIEAAVIAKTGISGIEYRNSWSMKNNVLLLTQLLSRLLSQPDKFSLPWHNLRLVFTIDHGYLGPHGQSAVAIDYLEGMVYIDCLEVSATWIDKLQYISRSEIAQVKPLQEEIESMRIHSEKYSRLILQSYYQKYLSSLPKLENSIERKRNIKELKINIKHGVTCSHRMFGQILHLFLSTVMQMDLSLLVSSTNNTQFIETANSNNISIHDPPLSLTIMVEISHGSKVLSDGTLQIDGQLLFTLQNKLKNVSFGDAHTKEHELFISLLVDHFGEAYLSSLLKNWLVSAVVQQQKLLEINTLTAHLTCSLGLKSLQMGLGVTQDMYLRFLRIATQYLDHENDLHFLTGNVDDWRYSSKLYDDDFHGHNSKVTNEVKYGGKTDFEVQAFEQFYYPYHQEAQAHISVNDKRKYTRVLKKGVLGHLADLSVTVGHYTGITEDGRCVLPWDFPLQQLMVLTS